MDVVQAWAIKTLAEVEPFSLSDSRRPLNRNGVVRDAIVTVDIDHNSCARVARRARVPNRITVGENRLVGGGAARG